MAPQDSEPPRAGAMPDGYTRHAVRVKAVALPHPPVLLQCRVTSPVGPCGEDRVPAPPRFVQQAVPEGAGGTIEYHLHGHILSGSTGSGGVDPEEVPPGIDRAVHV